MANPLVGIVMGSSSDWETMKAAAKMLEEFGVAYEAKAMSAHRTPQAVMEWTESAPKRGMKCLIAAAGGAAHLAGVVAAHTNAAGARCARWPSKHLQGARLAALHGPDAERHPGRDLRHR